MKLDTVAVIDWSMYIKVVQTIPREIISSVRRCFFCDLIQNSTHRIYLKHRFIDIFIDISSDPCSPCKLAHRNELLEHCKQMVYCNFI